LKVDRNKVDLWAAVLSEKNETDIMAKAFESLYENKGFSKYDNRLRAKEYFMRSRSPINVPGKNKNIFSNKLVTPGSNYTARKPKVSKTTA